MGRIAKRIFSPVLVRSSVETAIIRKMLPKVTARMARTCVAAIEPLIKRGLSCSPVVFFLSFRICSVPFCYSVSCVFVLFASVVYEPATLKEDSAELAVVFVQFKY